MKWGTHQWWDGKKIDNDISNIKIESVQEKHSKLPQTENNYHTGVDDIWIKKEYFINENSVKMCRTTKYRRYIFTKKIVTNRRESWKKFGNCKDVGPGLEENISYPGTLTNMIDPNKIVKRKEKVKSSSTSWKPKKYSGKTTTTNKEKYVPPGKRKNYKPSKNNKTTLRISNLNVDTDYYELKDICKQFGPIMHLKMIKDRRTEQFKGYAFVEYRSASFAQKALEKLHGTKLNHCIICVSYAKQKKK